MHVREISKIGVFFACGAQIRFPKNCCFGGCFNPKWVPAPKIRLNTLSHNYFFDFIQVGPCNRTNIDFGLHCQTEDNFRDHQNAIYSLPFLKQSLDKRVFWAVFGALNVVGNFCMYIWSPLLVHSTAFLCEYRRWFQKYSKPFITLTYSSSFMSFACLPDTMCRRIQASKVFYVASAIQPKNEGFGTRAAFAFFFAFQPTKNNRNERIRSL